MRQKFFNIALVFSVFLLASCDKGKDLPEGFEHVGGERNVFFVHVSGNILGEKRAQQKASAQLCEMKGFGNSSCEVYMWSDKERIARRLPVREESSYKHSYYKQDNTGEMSFYSCRECK